MCEPSVDTAQHHDSHIEIRHVYDRGGRSIFGRRFMFYKASVQWRRTTPPWASSVLDGIAPAPRGVPQIEVSFDIDANGILTVKAKDQATQREQHITVTGRSGMSEDDITSKVKEAEDNADSDRARRETADARNLRLTTASNDLQQAMMAAGQHIHAGAGAGSAPGPDGGPGPDAPSGDDTVEGKFREV